MGVNNFPSLGTVPTPVKPHTSSQAVWGRAVSVTPTTTPTDSTSSSTSSSVPGTGSGSGSGSKSKKGNKISLLSTCRLDNKKKHRY